MGLLGREAAARGVMADRRRLLSLSLYHGGGGVTGGREPRPSLSPSSVLGQRKEASAPPYVPFSFFFGLKLSSN